MGRLRAQAVDDVQRALSSLTTGASRNSARRSKGLFLRAGARMSRVISTPMTLSGSPSQTGSRERLSSCSCRRRSASPPAISNISTSWRGGIRPRAVRSAIRMTPAIIWLSARFMAPELSASATIRRTSSSLTSRDCAPDCPSSANTYRPERSSTQTSGPRCGRSCASSGRRGWRPVLVRAGRSIGLQFAHDQRRVGDRNHHRPHSNRLREGRGHAGLKQCDGDPCAQRRT